MILTSDDLFRLARLLPAVATGLVASTLGFLLARRTGNGRYRAFGLFVLSLLAYGASDFLIRFSWTHSGWTSFETRLSGAADLFSSAWIIRTLWIFSGELCGRPLNLNLRRLLWIPLGMAAALALSLVVPFFQWNEIAFQLTGLVFLATMLLAVAGAAASLLIKQEMIRDKTLKQLIFGTGILLLAFLPLWVLETLRVVQWGGFVWFLLVWNLAAMVQITRSHFQPVSNGPRPALFDESALERCADRYGLSPRETEVAGLHARGLSSTAIGNRLFIAPKTVRNHVANIYTKTDVHQRMALVELLAGHPTSR